MSNKHKWAVFWSGMIVLLLGLILGMMLKQDTPLPSDILRISTIEARVYGTHIGDCTKYRTEHALRELKGEMVYFKGTVREVTGFGSILIHDDSQNDDWGTTVFIRGATKDILLQLNKGDRVSGWGKIDHIEWFGGGPIISIKLVRFSFVDNLT